MTTNQTIDGVPLLVSREMLERWTTGRVSLSHLEEMRALLDAPVVERKPVACGQCGSTSADICNGNGCGYLESGNGEPEVDALQSTIAQLQARVAELESGKGEPIYEQRYGGGWISVGREEYERCLADPEEASSLRIVFTTPPAPVAAVTDERVAFESYYRDRIMGNRAGVRFLRSSGGSYLDREVCEMWSGWQARACLDATAALSKSP